MVFQPRGPGEKYGPLLFIGVIVLLVVGIGALLLSTPSSEEEGDLTAEEVRLMEEAMRSDAGFPEARLSASGAAGGGLAADLEEGAATLDIETAPAGARVFIDGEPAGLTPLRLRRLAERHYFVSVEGSGFPSVDTLLWVGEDMPVRLALNLARPAAPSAAPEPARGSAPTAPESGARPRVEAPAGSERPPPAARATGSVRVQVNPAGAPVLIAGRRVGEAPVEISDLAPGDHTLTIAAPGYETETVRVRVAPGARETVSVSLKALTGTLSVVVRPWGSVYIGGVLHARETDLSVEASLPVGRHEVRVVHPQLGTHVRTVEVHPDRRTSTVFDLN